MYPPTALGYRWLLTPSLPDCTHSHPNKPHLPCLPPPEPVQFPNARLPVGSQAFGGCAQQDAGVFILEVLGRNSNLSHMWTVPRQSPITYLFYLLSSTLCCLFGLLFFLLLFLFLFAQLLWWWSGRGWWGHSLLTFTLRLSLPLIREHIIRHTIFQRSSSDVCKSTATILPKSFKLHS